MIKCGLKLMKREIFSLLYDEGCNCFKIVDWILLCGFNI